MTTAGSWTGWTPHDTGASSYCIGRHTALALGSTYAFMMEPVQITGAGRMAVTYDNDAGSPFTVKHYITDVETPSSTFTSSEWYQIPDSSTTYTIAKTTGFQRVMIDFDTGSIGPATWFASVGSHEGTYTSTGSISVFVHLFSG